MIHIEGFIKDESDEWGTQIEIESPGMRWSGGLAKVINAEILEETKEVSSESLAKYDDEEGLIGVDISSNIPNVGLRIYYSDKECSLEEAQANVVLNTLGCLDIYQVTTGYSEWTTMGYDTENFKLMSNDGGEHDLNAIFAGLEGKYVHILIDVM